MIGSKPTDVIDSRRWPGPPCWVLGCCWAPPPAVARETAAAEDVTLCCICKAPVSMTETLYILGELVTHATCGAPIMTAAAVAAEGATT